MKALRRFTVRAQLPARLSGLAELSVNLRWSWHPASKALFRDLDPQAWLADVLARIAGIPQNRLHERLPWEWAAASPSATQEQAAAA